MSKHIEHINLQEGFFSEQEKVRLGLDIPSFARRMKERLNKVRGEANENPDIFLIRYHYNKNANIPA